MAVRECFLTTAAPAGFSWDRASETAAPEAPSGCSTAPVGPAVMAVRECFLTTAAPAVPEAACDCSAPGVRAGSVALPPPAARAVPGG
ncbi:hypothetical protein LAUMK13_00225 [Mycobacterium innocens]|uniref:Uncharacterized protein n=1 Tax=Mycobacterium innocens TaxID=2341083 RepID=A0A498PNT5_9MYCO|nr:hypothetical protein LAUMK13_00225 [Mycobacterium innocens]